MISCRPSNRSVTAFNALKGSPRREEITRTGPAVLRAHFGSRCFGAAVGPVLVRDMSVVVRVCV
jgi:hypothetical protein